MPNEMDGKNLEPLAAPCQCPQNSPHREYLIHYRFLELRTTDRHCLCLPPPSTGREPCRIRCPNVCLPNLTPVGSCSGKPTWFQQESPRLKCGHPVKMDYVSSVLASTSFPCARSTDFGQSKWNALASCTENTISFFAEQRFREGKKSDEWSQDSPRSHRPPSSAPNSMVTLRGLPRRFSLGKVSNGISEIGGSDCCWPEASS